MFFINPGKNKRLRQAKEEATAEVNQYKLKRESDFQRIQTTVSSSLRRLLNGPQCIWITA